MYGVNCSVECGTCVNNEVCHHINGSCLKGCDKGFYGQRCDQSNLRDHFWIDFYLDFFWTVLRA